MENTKIEWAHHSWNAWEGCAKVSPGCKHCYAAGQHEFWHAALGKNGQQGTCWGLNAPRMGKSEANWKLPLKWNRQAQAAGIRLRVFANSMGDVFEAQTPVSAGYAGQTAQVPTGKTKDGVPQTRTVTFVDLAAERLRLLRLIYDTPHLDWLLLTKRPEFILPALRLTEHTATSDDRLLDLSFHAWLEAWWTGTPPANVWLGTSVENQEQAGARIPYLLAAPATVRFLSCEPLLSAVDLKAAGAFGTWVPPGHQSFAGRYDGARVDWVIVGGESGPKARPMHPDWARGLRDQCQAAGVAYFFKQWGEYAPFYPSEAKPDGIGAKGRTDWYNWPGGVVSVKLGKHAAGRLLDGRTWDELPAGKEVARG